MKKAPTARQRDVSATTRHRLSPTSNMIPAERMAVVTTNPSRVSANTLHVSSTAEIRSRRRSLLLSGLLGLGLVEVPIAFLGFLGYALRRAKVDCSLLVLGLVLGPFLEDSIRRSLQLSAGSMGIFVSRPVGQVTICIVAIVWIILPIARALRVRAVSFSRSNSD